VVCFLFPFHAGVFTTDYMDFTDDVLTGFPKFLFFIRAIRVIRGLIPLSVSA
jgi:hypothetical protein